MGKIYVRCLPLFRSFLLIRITTDLLLRQVDLYRQRRNL